MNSWKLNSYSGHYYRQAICKSLGIHHTDIYKTVKNISKDGVVELHDGRKFNVILKQVKT